MCKAKRYKNIPNNRIDKCMRIFIKCLNTMSKSSNFKIVACCCGHNKYPMSIIVKEEFMYWDIVSGKLIQRNRNFYKRDKQGYYYIPEVSNESTHKG